MAEVPGEVPGHDLRAGEELRNPLYRGPGGKEPLKRTFTLWYTYSSLAKIYETHMFPCMSHDRTFIS